MDVVAETVETTTVYSLSLYFCVVEVMATAQAVVVAVMTAQALSGLFCFLAAVAVAVHSLVMETAVVAAASWWQRLLPIQLSMSDQKRSFIQ